MSVPPPSGVGGPEMPAVAEASANRPSCLPWPIPPPTSSALLRGRVCADVRPVPHSILKPSQCPASAFLLAPVTSVQPQVLKAWEQLLGTIEQRLDPLLVHHALATWTFAFSTKPSVSTSKWRF